MPGIKQGEQNSCPLSGERGVPCTSTPGHCDNAVEKTKVKLRKNNVQKAISAKMATKAMYRRLLGRESKHCTKKKYA